jgi:hypothetical protein
MNVKVKFKENNVSIPIKFSQIQSVSDPDLSKLPQYEGGYEINLSSREQTLETERKWVKENIVVKKVINTEGLNVTENGTYEASNDIDGFNPVTVNVKPKIEALNITQNGTYITAEGKDGFNPITVNVQPKLQEKSVTENGEVVADIGFDGLGKVNVNVNVQPTIEPLEITANGTYDLQEGVDGYAPITVNVQSDESINNAIVDALIDGSITEVDSNVIRVKQYTFNLCTELVRVNLPKVQTIDQNAFLGCSALKNIDLPALTSSGVKVFGNCSSLETANLPRLENLQQNFFASCGSLVSVDLSRVTAISSSAFSYCSKLTTLILRGDTVASLANTNAFNKCYHILGTVDATHNPEGLKDGYIYVPKALIEDYKVATNWVTYASQFRALEDYTVDGTVTGELDPTKI